MKVVKECKQFKLDIDISLDKNTHQGLYVFSGKSGCGKSTTLRFLFENHDYSNGLKIFMEPSIEFADSMKISELMRLSKKNYNERYYQDLQIEELLNKRFNKLSKGEQRRFYFYMIVSTKADIYLFDEPFSNVDEKIKKAMINIIEEISRDKIVFVALHEDEFTINHYEYNIENGKIAYKIEERNQNELTEVKDKNVFIKNSNRRLILHNFSNISLTVFFSIVIEIIAILISTFISTNSLRISQDVLGIFNSQNGIVVTSSQIDINYEELNATYQEIAKNENLQFAYSYELNPHQSFFVGNQINNMDVLYTKDDNVNGYYSSIYNPYLLAFFSQKNQNLSRNELIEYIKNYDYIHNEVSLNVSGILFGENYNIDILINGVMESSYYFISNIEIFDFFRSLNPNIISNKDPYKEIASNSISIYTALKSSDNSYDYLKYLSNKYPKYQYVTDNIGNIVASGNKNISIDEYVDFYNKLEDVFAYSLEDNYFCLKSSDFFKNNNFSYKGNLSINKGEVILSSNALYKLTMSDKVDSLINKQIEIQGKEYKISAILTEVKDSNIYFYSADYINDFAPIYSYSSTLLVNDYLKSDKIIEDLNNDSIGIKAKIIAKDIVDYREYYKDLEKAKSNVLNQKNVTIIISLVILILSIGMISIMIVKSFIFYNTLDILYIKTLKQRLIAIVFGAIIIFLIDVILMYPLMDLSKTIFFNQIMTSLNKFPINSYDITLSFNYLLICISISTMICGEFFNGRKIRNLFTKLFHKI